MAERPAGLRAVPRPDEHLRRPRQPAAARAPLRVARDRLRARRRRARRRPSTRTRTTSSTSAAARTATRRCARRTSPPSSATRCTPRPTRGARDLRASAAATSCSATATSWAASGSRASASSTSRPCASDGPRLIGNVAIEVELDGGAAQCSRASRTTAGARSSARARSRSAACCKGHGNNGADGFEGVRGGAHGTVLGTYLHGPLLPKNAWFADWLTATALGRPRPTCRRWTTRSRTPRTPGRARAAGVWRGARPLSPSTGRVPAHLARRPP